jgi:isoleucyl-tRNA synthetase
MTDTTTSTRDYRETVFLPRTDFPMRAGLPKQEPKWLKFWEERDVYGQLRTQRADAETFVLHDGPPYANGHLHIGHALNKILKDMVVRSQTMLGKNAPYVPGWDCHGLPIEWKVEEQFRSKGRKKDDVPASEFRSACREYAAEWITIQSEEFQRFGVMGDWENRYATMDFDTEAAIVAEFLKFAEAGLVYRGSKPVMWSPVEQTALAEAEIEYHDHQSPTIWVRFPVSQGPVKGDILIWTTTPWTIPGNRAIAYGPSVSYGLYEITAMETITDPKTGEIITPWAKPGDRLLLADALAETVAQSARIAEWKRVQDITADELAQTKCAHPLAQLEGGGDYWQFDVPLLAGGHVTEDAGTGFVHTAPSHGKEDFDVWVEHGLPLTDIPDMIDAHGAYYDHVPVFAGEQVIRTEGKKSGKEGGANPAVIKALIGEGALLARGRLEHSYPHSWRSKAPILFRNTPQWFIAMDRTIDTEAGKGRTLREIALSEIERVTWHPASARNRIRAMVADRPDWLISRQRAWGVPITLFVNDRGEVLNDEGVNQRIIKAVAEGGTDAWWEADKASLLGPDHDPQDWEKVTDVLDVWFDSGTTHAFCLEARDDLPWPADLYLEGSDQHRGWFQSSLLESCGTRGRAPYEAVLTHGFTLDEQGRKMSKSLGNAVDPAKIIQQYGAEILRIWVATTDYSQDQRIGEAMIQSAVDGYRKLRNTLRYLIGGLDGYSSADEEVDAAEMPALERYMLHRLAILDAKVREDYARYDIKSAFRAIAEFCTNDCSAFYFDVRKDALYCDHPEGMTRRANRTVMDALFRHLSAWLAPIMPFTMEEVNVARFGEDAPSVHLSHWPDAPAEWIDNALEADWKALRALRRVALGALEIERGAKRIGDSLEAHLVISMGSDHHAALTRQAKGSGMAAQALLADLAIVSFATISDSVSGFALDEVPGVSVAVGRADGVRCARSRRFFDPTTADPAFPDITPRDAQVVKWWDATHG